MTIPSSCVGGVPQSPTPPPPPPALAATKKVSLPSSNGASPDANLLLADIRNGVALKPTKTKDKSTAAFIKKSQDSSKSPSPQPSEQNGQDIASMGDMKDALQEELRNTLKRKVKKQDVERGDSSKKDEIEKAMEVNRTEVQLKLNSTPKASPNMARKDTVDKAVVMSPTLKRAPPKPERVMNGNVEESMKAVELAKSPVLQRPPAKPARAQPMININPVQQTTVSNGLPKKEEFKEQSAAKVEIKPLVSGKVALNGTLKKVNVHKELKIDVSVGHDGTLKNSILSPEVKSGNAAIRPSQIKTLTKQGSHVSHTDIVQDAKPITKSPVSLVESPKPSYSPPTPKSTSPFISSGQFSPRTPTRTTILDTKIGNGFKSPMASPKIDPNAPPKKLLISHPRANFTLNRTNSRQGKNGDITSTQTETKPVFRILTNLEQAERLEAEHDQTIKSQTPAKKSEPPKADEPGTEPVLTSYVSFAKELANAPNNYPDTVTKKTAIGFVKDNLFFESTNLRDIKIDIVENGKLRVVNK